MSSKDESRGIVIREAQRTDCTEIARLIKDLAEYQGLANKAELTQNDLEEDGFGEDRFFLCFVAEHPDGFSKDTGRPRLIGHCLYFFTYTSPIGRSVHMEDLYVEPQFRNQGIGTRMMKRLAQKQKLQMMAKQNAEMLSQIEEKYSSVRPKVAIDNDCVMNWTCLGENHSSMAFYKRLGAKDLAVIEGLRYFSLEKSAFETLARS